MWSGTCVDPRNTGRLVDVLLRVPAGKNLYGCGDLVSWTAYMALWSEIMGVPARAKELPVDGRDEALPGGFGSALREGMKLLSDFGSGLLLMPGDIRL